MFETYSGFRYLGKTLDPSFDNRLPHAMYAQVTKTSGFPFFRKSEHITVYILYGSASWRELDSGKYTTCTALDCMQSKYEAETGVALCDNELRYTPL